MARGRVEREPASGRCYASSMARERGLEFKVGLLIIASTAILVGFIFVLGNFSLRSGFEVQVDFNYVGSLQPGAPVKVSGIKVAR